MTVLISPSILTAPAACTWRLEANTQHHTSPLTRSTQTVDLPGARWIAEMTLPPMTESSWREMSVFVARMRGGAGRAYVAPPHYSWGGSTSWVADPSALRFDSSTVTFDSDIETFNQETRSPEDMVSAVVVATSGQTGASLAVSGWVGGQPLVASGDYVSYDTPSGGRQMHIVTAATSADDAGVASIPIEPPIRQSPAAGVSVELEAPTCIMRMADDQQGAVSFSAPLIGAMSLALIEVF